MDKALLLQIGLVVGGAVLGFGFRAAANWIRSRAERKRKKAGELLREANEKVLEARATPDKADDKAAEDAFAKVKPEAEKELAAAADLEALASTFETADPKAILNKVTNVRK